MDDDLERDLRPVLPRALFKAMGMNHATGYKALEEGLIPEARRIGRVWYIPYGAVRRWLDAGTATTR